MQEKRGLGPFHGVLIFLMAMLFMLFGGSLLIPLFGSIGAYLAGVVLALMAIAFTAATKTKPSAVFPFALPPVRQFFSAVLLYVGTMMFNSCYGMIVSLFSVSDTRGAAIDSFISSVSPLTAILLVAVLPALCEEFFCRGFLRHCFRNLGGDWFVIVVTAVMFGCLHLDLYSLLPTTMMGLLFGFLAVKTKSLLLPILLHFFNNAISVVVAYAPSALGESTATVAEMNLGARISLAVFYGGLCVMCFFFGYRLFRGVKVFSRPGVKVFVILLVLLNAANLMFSVFSIRVTAYRNKTVSCEGSFRIVEEITVEEDGEYLFLFQGECDGSFQVIFRQGSELLILETEEQEAHTVSQKVTLAAGEYEVILLGDSEGGTLSYFLLVMNGDLVSTEALE